jgi:ElaB/YqjD/DUF883 family membrane-anchored ribosome-binding protein
MDAKLENQAKEASQQVATAPGTEAAATTLAEKARQGALRMGEAWKSTRANLQEKSVATDRAIRDNPYASIGVAFGLGLLIGVLVNRGRE